MRNSHQPNQAIELTFHLGYIMIPLVTLILAIIMTAIFYPQLPGPVAYHFQANGLPDRSLSRGALALLTVLPQLFFTLLAGAIAWGITRFSARLKPPDSARIKTERIITIMGNMVALPQIILAFAMLDIFLYNSYQIHLMPFWALALIIVGIGTIIMGIFFIRALGQTHPASR